MRVGGGRQASVEANPIQLLFRGGRGRCDAGGCFDEWLRLRSEWLGVTRTGIPFCSTSAFPRKEVGGNAAESSVVWLATPASVGIALRAKPERGRMLWKQE